MMKVVAGLLAQPPDLFWQRIFLYNYHKPLSDNRKIAE